MAQNNDKLSNNWIGILVFKKTPTKNILKAFNFLKYTQWQCKLSYDNSTAMHKFLKTLHPGGIRTRDLLFCRWTR
jgi:hypothetical protein